MQDVIGARARFPKPMGPYKILLTFGPNLVASEGDEWRRQRKLVAPAFSEVRSCLQGREHIRASVADSVRGCAMAEEQQARMGRDDPGHVRPVR